jgi:signal peptidase I
LAILKLKILLPRRFFSDNIKKVITFIKMNEFKNIEEQDKNERKSVYLGMGGFMLEIIKIVFLAFLIFVPVRFFLFQPFFVQGSSMEPNFENNEYLVIRELGYKKIAIGKESNRIVDIAPFKNLERQWPTVFRYPKDPSKFFIKRVIGLPGEKIEISNNKVIIFNKDNPNGFFLDESAYLGSDVKTAGDLILNLKDDEYFVMGDNRMFSSDSRYWGPIKVDDIVGKVILRAWPLNKIGIF